MEHHRRRQLFNKILRGGLLLAAFFILFLTSLFFTGENNFHSFRVWAQGTFELTCPLGTSSYSPLQTFDGSTGKYRQNVCIDANGNMTISAIVGGAGTATGYQGKLFNATDSPYGLNINNTAAQNNTSLTTLATAVNSYVGASDADFPVIYIPGGNASGASAVYSYSGGLVFTRPVSIECGRGAVLNYTGSAHAADFGPTGLTNTTISSQQASNSVYTVTGCTFTGGGSMTEGLNFNPFVYEPRVHDNTFFDFGNATTTVFAVLINPNISSCDIENNYFNNNDNVARNGIRIDGTSGNFNDQCHVIHNIIQNNNYVFGNPTNSATNFGISIWVDGAGSLVANNNMGFCAPCVRIGPGLNPGVNGTRVVNNFMEGPNAAVSTPIIQYGDPGSATFVDSPFIMGNFILANNSANVLMGPSSATTGLINAMIANNRIVSSFSSPLVVTNNVAGQTGNTSWDNICGSSPGVQCGQLVTVSGNVTAWGTPGFPILENDGTAAVPSYAFTGAPSLGFRRVVSGNDNDVELDGNSGVGANALGIAAQNASAAYAGFYLNHPSDTQAFPNRGFTLRHVPASSIDALTGWEGFGIAFLTGSAGSPTQRFTITTTGLALGAAPTLFISTTAPTIAAAGCGGAAASIVVSNGTAAFKINVGTTPGSACTFTMPAATTGWNSHCDDITTQSTSVFLQKQTGAESTTSVTITNFNDVAVATAFVASDILKCTASAD